jgi:hypothetical protein
MVPAARIPTLLLGILADAIGRLEPTTADDHVPPDARRALAPVQSLIPSKVPDALVQRGLMAWAALFGTVSFELFGQLHHIIGDEPGDRDAYFAECVRRWTTRVGIDPEQTRRLAREPKRALEAVSE